MEWVKVRSHSKRILEEDILRKGEDRLKNPDEEWNEEDGVGEAK